MTLEQEIQEVTYTEGLEVDKQSVFSKQEKEISLEQEIKDFMHDQGIDVVGVAGPGRFDGPPSLDPEYIMKGAKSVVTFALPLDAQATYDYLEKKSAIPHNLDLIRVHQRLIHAGLKLSRFLESKGFKAKIDEPNIKWRGTLNPFAYTPPFSHRYASYITGIAAPGLSGAAVTKEYGGSIILASVFTNAELESDPIMDPREIYDGICQKCMACAASCPTKMFANDEEEYALINGQLYPRGKKRDINLCSYGCAGFHAPAPNLKYSSWGRGYNEKWIGQIPDPKEHNILWELIKSTFRSEDFASIMGIADTYSYPLEEGIFEAPNFPNYEDLPGETEGQKMQAYAEELEKILKIPIDFPFVITCASCAAVCGPNIKENQKRWKMLCKSGFVVLGENKEPVVTHDAQEALAIRKANPWIFPEKIKKIRLKSLWRMGTEKFGIDLHGTLRRGRYYRRLEQAIAEQGKQETVEPSVREKVLEDIGALDGLQEANG